MHSSTSKFERTYLEALKRDRINDVFEVFHQEWNPLSSQALAEAVNILTRLSCNALENCQVCGPLYVGGLQLEWRTKTRSVEIEVSQEGRLKYLLFFRAEENSSLSTVMEKRVDVSVAEVVKEINDWLA